MPASETMQASEAMQARSFSEYLTEQCENMDGCPKRERTRARILAATARQLEIVGYDALTVDDIIQDLGMGRGTFYIYFENRSYAAEAVMHAYIDSLVLDRPQAEQAHAFDTLLRFHSYYVARYAKNARLLACLQPLCRERQDLADFRHKVNHEWCQAVIRDLEKRCGPSALNVPTQVKTLLVWSMSALVDELLREMYINQSKHLKGLTKSTDQVAELISVIWYRSIYAEDVPVHKLKWSESLSQMRLLP